MNTQNPKTLESLARIIRNLESRGIYVPYLHIKNAWEDPSIRPYLEPLDSPSPRDEHFDTFVEVYNIYVNGKKHENTPSPVKSEERSTSNGVNESQPIQSRNPPVQQLRPYNFGDERRTTITPSQVPRQGQTLPPSQRQQPTSTPNSRQSYQAVSPARNGQSSYAAPQKTLPPQPEDGGSLSKNGEPRRYLPSASEVSIYSKDNEGAVCFVVASQRKDRERPEFGDRVIIKAIPQINNRYNPEAQKVFALTDEETLYFIKRLMNVEDQEIAFLNHGKQGEPRKHLFISTSKVGRIRLNLREKGYSRIATLDEWHRFKAISIAARALASTLACTPQEVLYMIKSSNIRYPDRIIPEKFQNQQSYDYDQQSYDYEEPPVDEYPDYQPPYDSRGFE